MYPALQRKLNSSCPCDDSNVRDNVFTPSSSDIVACLSPIKLANVSGDIFLIHAQKGDAQTFRNIKILTLQYQKETQVFD